MGQNSCNLAVGVIVKQPVNFGYEMSGVFTQLGYRGRRRLSDRVGRASLKAGMGDYSAVFGKRYILNYAAEYAYFQYRIGRSFLKKLCITT